MSRLSNWLWERVDVVNWLTLRELGNHRVVRSSYIWLIIVPLCARAFDTANAKQEVNLFGTTIPINFHLPFSWKVFYFSAVAIAVGRTIFAVRCTSIVKDLADFSEFVDREGASKLMLSLPVAQNAKRHGRRAELVTFIAQFCSPNERSSESQVIPMNHDTILTDFEIQTAKLPDAFQMSRALVSRWHPLARLCCGLCFAVGFGLLSWVFIDTFLFVIEVAT
jgi:hypothetical protein